VPSQAKVPRPNDRSRRTTPIRSSRGVDGHALRLDRHPPSQFGLFEPNTRLSPSIPSTDRSDQLRTPDSHPRLQLRPLEIAFGMPIGLEPVPPLTRSEPIGTPLDALCRVMAEALQRPPCLVSFSGGRDSSALLAVATRVARQENLPLPVPATLIFRDSEPSTEDEWQTMVIEHLGLSEWIRIEIHSELDAIGPVATKAFEHLGLYWPFNAHFHLPIMEQAGGGTVITGFGGDELALCSVSARAERLLTQWHRPRWSDALVIGLATSPLQIRTVVHRRRAREELRSHPWLTETGLRQVGEAYGSSEALIPLGWEAKVRRWLWRDRYFRMCVDTFAEMGELHDVELVHPFIDELVLDSLARAGGFRGFGDRTRLMDFLFGDFLPQQIISRPTKAAFSGPLWTNTSTLFARRWSGDALLEGLVDDVSLKHHWGEEHRNLLSTTVLQLARIRELGLPLTT
jgi:hypothetical protein